ESGTTRGEWLSVSGGVAAARHGAVLANYVEAAELAIEGGRAIGVGATDRHSSRSLQIAARVVVNATGGAVDRLLAPSGITSGVPMLKAMNLVTSREAPHCALGGRGPSGRTLFCVPWQGRALFGTWESATVCAPDDMSINSSDVTAFLAEVNHAFPAASLGTADVTLVHLGV